MTTFGITLTASDNCLSNFLACCCGGPLCVVRRCNSIKIWDDESREIVRISVDLPRDRVYIVGDVVHFVK